MRRAAAFFASAGIAVERVPTDNAGAYAESRAFAQALAGIGARPRFIRAYRPRTNGRAERFNRPLVEERAYARAYSSSAERARALEEFLHAYDHHRCHPALAGRAPISRVNNAPGHYGQIVDGGLPPAPEGAPAPHHSSTSSCRYPARHRLLPRPRPRSAFPAVTAVSRPG
ncbi:hypothetical protein HDA36_002884 [Nocardiopsis composta]|uniref:Integrase catalytic domain-containing protein n=1 Tax=Nocardiopsis composta TaxID=157465 RepID=A0A7W8QM16_9ACTN|nr:hypothetical protein [Nocardiopsis composta]